MINKLISAEAIDKINHDINEISTIGGLIQVYDSQTGSLIMVVCSKEGKTAKPISWNIMGPMTKDAAIETMLDMQFTNTNPVCQ